MSFDDSGGSKSPQLSPTSPSNTSKRALLSSSSSKQASNRANYSEETEHKQRMTEKLQKSLDDLVVTIVSSDDDDDDDDDDDEEEEEEEQHAKPKQPTTRHSSNRSSDDETEEEGDVLGDLHQSEQPAGASSSSSSAVTAMSGVMHLNMMLERKPTLEVEFMRNLMVPDPVVDRDNLFETNRGGGQTRSGDAGSPITDGGGGGGSSLRLRKTGFESWVLNPLAAQPQQQPQPQQAECLLACRNLSVNISGTAASSSSSLLKSVSLALFARRTTLLIGPPGAPTSALLRSLAGLKQHQPQQLYLTVDALYSPTHCHFISSSTSSSSSPAELTVRETLEYQARLVVEHDKTPEALAELVDRVVESLGLGDQAHVVVGGGGDEFPFAGLTPSQSRRLQLGQALFASKTRRVLLLDEITHGLGASETQQLMRILRSACKVLGFSCLCALQQPSDMVFDSFDDVCVLSARGEVAFAGRAADCVEYFEHKYAPPASTGRPGGMSAAEYIQLCLSISTTSRPRPGRVFSESADGLEHAKRVDDALEQGEEASDAARPLSLRLLLERHLVVLSRSAWVLQRLVIALAFSLVFGSLFSQLGPSSGQASVFRNSFLFALVFFLYALTSLGGGVVVLTEEEASSSDVVRVYAAHALAQLPLAVVDCLLFSLVPYWWVGLNPAQYSLAFCYFVFVLLAVELNGLALGRLLSVLCGRGGAVALVGVPYMLLGALVCGWAPHYSAIPEWWQWLNWLNPMSYAVEGLAVAQFLLLAGEEEAEPPASSWTLTVVGTPRFPVDGGYGSLNTPSKVMAFDFGMLLVFATLVDLAGMLVLAKTHRRPMAAMPTTLSAKDVAQLSNTATTYFAALNRQHEREQDGEEGAEEEKATASPPPRLTLALVDVSLSTTPYKRCGGVKVKNDMYWYTRALFAARNLVRRPKALLELPLAGTAGAAAAGGAGDDVEAQLAANNNTLLLPSEERIQMSVHRPRGAQGEEGGAARERAWSNKLPASLEGEGGEDDDDQPAAGEIQLVTRVGASFRSGELSLVLSGNNNNASNATGELLRFMAQSGSNSSTKVRSAGQMYVNRSQNPREWQRVLVTAHDTYAGQLTPREAIRFAAVGGGAARVDELLLLLGLDEEDGVVCANQPRHVQRLVGIGMRLVAVAQTQMLFVEEPVRELDARGSELVVAALRRLTRELDIITVCSHAQPPSRQVFAHFDRLLLVDHAEVVYHGAISSFDAFAATKEEEAQQRATAAGADWRGVSVIHRQPSGIVPQNHNSSHHNLAAALLIVAEPTIGDAVLAYFSSLGAPPLRQGFNPADHIILACDALVDNNGVNVADIFAQSAQMRDMHQEIARAIQRDLPPPAAGARGGAMGAFGKMIMRHWLVQRRTPHLLAYRTLWTVLSALFIGTIFYVRDGGQAVQCLYMAWLRVASLFFVVLSVALYPLLVLPMADAEEEEERWTSASAAAVARMLAELPLHAIFAVLFYAIAYYALGFQRGAEETGYFILMLFFTMWALAGFTRLVGSVSSKPCSNSKKRFLALVLVLSVLLMGFLVPTEVMPAGWRWAAWLNMLYYPLRGLAVNELSGSYFVLPLVGGVGGVCPTTTVLPFPPLFQSSSSSSCTPQMHELLVGELLSLVECAAAECSTLRCAANLCGEEIHVLAQDWAAVPSACWAAEEEAALDARVRVFAAQLASTAGNSVEYAALEAVFTGELVSSVERNVHTLAAAGRVFAGQHEALAWFRQIATSRLAVIPGEAVLSQFGWWDISNDDNTQWWFCAAVMCIFVAAWEVLGVAAAVLAVQGRRRRRR